MKSIEEIEAERNWKLSYWRAAAPVTLVAMVAAVMVSAYFLSVNFPFLLLNAVAGIFLYFAWTVSPSSLNRKLAWSMAAVVLFFVASFVVAEPPPTKVFRSSESQLYFSQALGALGAAFSLCMLLSKRQKS